AGAGEGAAEGDAGEVAHHVEAAAGLGVHRLHAGHRPEPVGQGGELEAVGEGAVGIVDPDHPAEALAAALAGRVERLEDDDRRLRGLTRGTGRAHRGRSPAPAGRGGSTAGRGSTASPSSWSAAGAGWAPAPRASTRSAPRRRPSAPASPARSECSRISRTLRTT